MRAFFRTFSVLIPMYNAYTRVEKCKKKKKLLYIVADVEK